MIQRSVTRMIEPKLRFPEFKDSWNNYKIEDMFDRVGTPVDLDDTQTYREIGIRSHGKGIFHKEETTATEIGNKRVFWVEPDCFVVNIVFAWERAVAKTTEKENGMIASHRFPMYKPKKDVVDLDYITEYFITKRGQNVLILASPGGAGRNKTLGQKEFAKSVVKLPSLPEQQKIADFLSTIDTVITKQKETVSAWEERKKGVMQKLFSQEVRFKADDGSDYPDWEEKKLKNILKEYKEYSAKDGSYEHVSLTKEGVVPKSERYERDFLVKDVDKKYRITHLGDICYNPANLKFGVICRNKYGDGIFSPIYVTFRVCKDMLPEFVEMLVTRRDFIEYALKYQQGTVYERMSVSPDDLLSIKVMVPCMAEQKKIADCLVSLDNVINSYKATLSAWEELKKGLLQQMFV